MDRAVVSQNAGVLLRRKLLDLSRQNNLISFKHSAHRRDQIRVIDESPNFLFQRLNKGKPMRFAHLPDPESIDDQATPLFQEALEKALYQDDAFLEAADKDPAQEQAARQRVASVVRARLGWPPVSQRGKHAPETIARLVGLNPSYDLPETPWDEARAPKSHGDNTIQTLLTPELFERHLAVVFRKEQLMMSETGLNTLFAAFGFLQLVSGDAVQLNAPLLLVPVSLQRESSDRGYRYQVRGRHEEPVVNPALSAYVHQHFGIQLPTLVDDQNPETYFAVLEQSLADKPEWRVRRQVTFGLFSFARTVMYQYLEDDGIWRHPLLQDLLAGGGEPSLDVGRATSEQVDMDPHLPLIADADVSQCGVIQDVLAGRSLVVEGPPGTGKSQTITNLIAALLARGKTVLFVAEKMAALEVVETRLHGAGLGPFCMELHSTKTRKAAVMAAMAERLAMTRQSPEPLAKPKHQETLDFYHRDMQAPLYPNGPSCFEVIWRDVCLDRHPHAKPLRKLRLDLDMLDMGDTLQRAEDALEVYTQYWRWFADQHGSPERHPWLGLEDAALSPNQMDRLVVILQEMAQVSQSILDALADLEPDSARIHVQALRDLPEQIALLTDLETSLPTKLHKAVTTESQMVRLRALVAKEVDCWTLNMALAIAFGRYTPESIPDLSQGLQTVMGLLRKVKSELLDRQALEALRVQEQAQLEALEEVARCYQALRNRLGLAHDEALTLEQARQLRIAAELLSRLDELDLALVDASVFDTSRLPDLTAAAQWEQRLLAAEKDVHRHLNAPPHLPDPIYGKASKWVRRSGLVNLLAGKRGELASLRARLGLDATLSKQTQSAVLARLDAWLGDVAAYQEAPYVANALGSHAPLPDGRAKRLLALNRWAGDVRTELPLTDSLGAALQVFLLQGDKETLLNLRAMLQSVDWKALDALKGRRKGTPLSTYKDRQQDRVNLLEECCDLLEGMQLDAATAFKTLPKLHADLKQAALLNQASSRRGEKLAGVGLDRARYQPLQMQRIMTVTEGILDLPFSQALKARLLRGDFDGATADLKAGLQRCAASLNKVEHLTEHLLADFKIDVELWCNGHDFNTMPLADLSERAAHAAANRSALEGVAGLIEKERQLSRLGLGALVRYFYSARIRPEDFRGCFDVVWSAHLARRAVAGFPKQAVGRLEEMRAQWSEQDRGHIQAEAAQIIDKLLMRPFPTGNNTGPKGTWTGYHLIRNEAGKVTRHLPIRQLMLRAGKTLQQLTPCFLMSPLSVPHYLPKESDLFDVVIMDEASQIRPEDALCAVSRGRQLVVIGDPKQLGPTNFFRSDDGEDQEIDMPTERSILELTARAFHPGRALNHHYRSQHPSLIAPSNKMFYGNNLKMLPTPTPRNPELGFQTRFIFDGIYEDRKNVAEANAVLETARDLMIREPETSMGIVAVNQSQMEILETGLDALIMQDESVRAYHHRWEETLEPLFVKNLENVQGDERDIILVSTVYGRNREGRFFRRFGPINMADGARRLNVLFTRAKRRLILHTSMRPEWIPKEPDAGSGRQALRTYLEFGASETVQTTDLIPKDNSFAAFLAHHLEQTGYQAVMITPPFTHFLSMAVRDPNNPKRFLLGIIDDGPNAPQDMRTRLRLRQQALQRMGWQIHQLWSLDHAVAREIALSQILSHLDARSKESQAGT